MSFGLHGHYLSVLQNNKTFRFSPLVYGMYANLCFSGTRVDWWLINKNTIFSVSVSFLFPVWFCIYTQFRILEFQDCVYQKEEVCAKTINEWRASERSVILLRRQGDYRMTTHLKKETNFHKKARSTA